jgi:cellulose synthase/poly-beta-1,6-N-acetylglucosamine synthase-like glycosyltransferase
MLQDILIYVSIAILSIGVFLPSYWAWRLIIYYARHSRVTPPVAEPCPKVTIILCLRGADPSLASCLTGVLNQDYPRYQVHIVVDHREDSAWTRTHEILARGVPAHVEVHVNVLKHPCATCSLKACAQLQVIGELDLATDIVVLIDADSIPARDWLRALVLPFTDPKVGAATGMRWFAPADGDWGSLIRHLYNAGSSTQMLAFEHAWGGSVAIRAEVFRASTLKHRWRKALCEDSALTGPLREMGLTLVLVPNATNINTESISVPASLRFVQRQLLCVRLDHVDWHRLLGWNVFHVFAVNALMLLGAIGVYVERWDWVGLSGGMLTTFAVTMTAGFVTGEMLVRRNYRLRGLTPPPLVWTWKLVPALLYTHLISMRFLRKVHFLKRVSWRGIHYTISGPGNIRLEKYEPYQPPLDPAKPDHSVV